MVAECRERDGAERAELVGAVTGHARQRRQRPASWPEVEGVSTRGMPAFEPVALPLAVRSAADTGDREGHVRNE